MTERLDKPPDRFRIALTERASARSRVLQFVRFGF
jgi:hypothetical protein